MSSVNRDLNGVKTILLQRKRELEEILARNAKEKFSDGQVQDPGDQALTSTMELLHGSLQDAELEEYRRINRAIAKIDDGSYGVCVDCNNGISEKRLKSYPDAARCLACQEEFEDMARLQ